jgi:hypothetical protein
MVAGPTMTSRSSSYAPDVGSVEVASIMWSRTSDDDLRDDDCNRRRTASTSWRHGPAHTC